MSFRSRCRSTYVTAVAVRYYASHQLPTDADKKFPAIVRRVFGGG